MVSSRRSAEITRKRASEREAVARALLRHVREHGADGSEIRGMDAFRSACQACSNLEWVRYIEAKPKARAAITAVLERLMRSEFADVEKRKHGSSRSSRVSFRLRMTKRA
jgi:hypothetical protein